MAYEFNPLFSVQLLLHRAKRVLARMDKNKEDNPKKREYLLLAVERREAELEYLEQALEIAERKE